MSRPPRRTEDAADDLLGVLGCDRKADSLLRIPPGADGTTCAAGWPSWPFSSANCGVSSSSLVDAETAGAEVSYTSEGVAGSVVWGLAAVGFPVVWSTAFGV